jgi:hypothetical protein
VLSPTSRKSDRQKKENKNRQKCADIAASIIFNYVYVLKPIHTVLSYFETLSIATPSCAYELNLVFNASLLHKGDENRIFVVGFISAVTLSTRSTS